MKDFDKKGFSKMVQSPDLLVQGNKGQIGQKELNSGLMHGIILLFNYLMEKK